MGMIVLAVWLILTGIFALVPTTFQGQGVVMGVLALVAGILILVGR
jgi:uncharacterized membrane protein HdeD (DUF308 family)